VRVEKSGLCTGNAIAIMYKNGDTHWSAAVERGPKTAPKDAVSATFTQVQR
jgi:hypothetical protein